jgi:hypothetical protein
MQEREIFLKMKWDISFHELINSGNHARASPLYTHVPSLLSAFDLHRTAQIFPSETP